MNKSLAATIAAVSLMTAGLSGHGIVTEIRSSGRVIIVNSTYGPYQPLKGASVTIWSPDSQTEVWQGGITDREGNFAFIPDRAGEWIFVVDDQKGHREKLTVPVPEAIAEAGLPSSSAEPHSGSQGIAGSGNGLKLITGLALIFGITGIWYGIRSGRAK